MPNLTNAKKALRQSVKRAAKNKVVKDEIASLRRHFKVALKDKKLEEAKTFGAQVAKKMDKAAGKKILKMAKAITKAAA